jgi:chitin disaccharide deacetylase
MAGNPGLARLGFAHDARVVVLHADDIGMCQATNVAYARALDFGVLSSAATMTPCPWFSGLARFCRERGGDGRVDMGVHLTLNCEWSDYRWGPTSAPVVTGGLVAADGAMHRRALDVVASADLAALERELRAQVERALAQGIDVTHVDTHMLTLWHPRFLEAYVRVAFDFGVPLFLLRRAEAMLDAARVDALALAESQALVDAAQARGMVLFDAVHVLPLNQPSDRIGEMRRLLANVQPGTLTNILIHPAVDTPELRAIAPDWACRVADSDLFTSEALREAVTESGVQVIGFRALRDALRRDVAVAD